MNHPYFTTVNTAANAANMAAQAAAQPQPQPYPPYPQQPQPPAYGGYPPAGAQPCYAQAPAYPPQQAPEFALRYKDPRKTGAVRTLNIMGLLLVSQIALSLALQLAAVYGCLAMGFNLYNDSLAQLLLSLGLSPICTVAPFLFYMLAGKKDWNWHFRFERRGGIAALLVVFATLGVCMAANFPAGLVSQLLGRLGAKEVPTVLGRGGWTSFIVELVGVAVLVPVMEEFAFRGVLLSALRRYGTGFAIAASGLIFGMAHISPSGVVFATISGMAMGTAYVLTGNLWITVLIHSLNNMIATAQNYSWLFVSSEKQAAINGEVTLSFIGVGVVCLVLLLIFRKRLFPREAQPQPPMDAALPPLRFGEGLLCMVKSPVLWAIIAMLLVETALLFL